MWESKSCDQGVWSKFHVNGQSLKNQGNRKPSVRGKCETPQVFSHPLVQACVINSQDKWIHWHGCIHLNPENHKLITGTLSSSQGPGPHRERTECTAPRKIQCHTARYLCAPRCHRCRLYRANTSHGINPCSTHDYPCQYQNCSTCTALKM